MNRVSAYPRIVRVVVGAAAALTLLAGAVACKVVDRPVRIEHASAEPCRPGGAQR